MTARRLLPALTVALAGALLAAPAGGQGIDLTSTNPCDDPLLALRCPDLRMAPPSDPHVQRAGKVVRLLATNHIVNVGRGPLELIGTRDPARPRFAHATQIIRTRTGRPVYLPEAGWIYFKAIRGQGHYWKYYRAARCAPRRARSTRRAASRPAAARCGSASPPAGPTSTRRPTTRTGSA